MKLLMTLAEAAEYVPFSKYDLRLAVNQNYSTEWNENRIRLPRLRAKQGKRGQYLVTRTELEAWCNSLPDHE